MSFLFLLLSLIHINTIEPIEIDCYQIGDNQYNCYRSR